MQLINQNPLHGNNTCEDLSLFKFDDIKCLIIQNHESPHMRQHQSNHDNIMML